MCPCYIYVTYVLTVTSGYNNANVVIILFILYITSLSVLLLYICYLVICKDFEERIIVSTNKNDNAFHVP